MATPKHWPVLDGLRGIAILLVFGFHLGQIEGDASSVPARALEKLYDVGWVGVDLFFVLSGFLITSILLRELDSPRYFRDFYIRRTLRIFPVYYLLLIVRFLVIPLFDPSQAIAWSVQLRAWFYVSNWSLSFGDIVKNLPHIWSLALEEQFYLAWPAAVWLVPRRFHAHLCLGAIATAFAWRVVGTLEHSQLYVYEVTIARLDTLALGALIAVVLGHPRWGAALRDRARLAWWLAAVAVLPLLVIGRWQPYHTTIGYSSWALLFAATVARCVTLSDPGVWWFRALSSKPLREIGKYSYGAYIWHMPLHLAAYPHVAPYIRGHGLALRLGMSLAYVVAMFAVVFALAVLSYRVYEKRFLALKDVWAPLDRRPPRDPTRT